MADKLLKSIKFPTLPDRYVIGDTTLTEEGAAADAKAVGDALAKKADTKGTYEDLIAGGAEQLMADEYETDKDPYLFRPTGGSADVGNREYLDKIVGGTVAWNQLVGESATSVTVQSGHKYIAKIGGAWSVAASSGSAISVTGGTDMLIDLTAMFGITIADYIYSLEQSQAGAGVAWFRRYFSKSYYPYDPGTLRSVEGVSAHETVGFNQWDEEWEVGGLTWASGEIYPASDRIRSKNFCRILPNVSYYFKRGAGNDGAIFFYDENKEFILYTSFNRQENTPSNAHYFKIGNIAGTTYNDDICINLSDPSRNGEYEPYQKHTYPLDSSLTLRGVPKLVDGKLAYDGDIYPPSGEVQRRYGLRAYQSGDESLADAITDGTNTVYKLATPTTETADGYEQYQMCDPSGTEEFVTTGIVPVGHETRYPHDLKKKIETAPDNPSADGTYLMKRSGGKNTYMALPSTPSANGSYVLTVTVSGGTASYSWTAKE